MTVIIACNVSTMPLMGLFRALSAPLPRTVHYITLILLAGVVYCTIPLHTFTPHIVISNFYCFFSLKMCLLPTGQALQFPGTAIHQGCHHLPRSRVSMSGLTNFLRDSAIIVA